MISPFNNSRTRWVCISCPYIRQALGGIEFNNNNNKNGWWRHCDIMYHSEFIIIFICHVW